MHVPDVHIQVLGNANVPVLVQHDLECDAAGLICRCPARLNRALFLYLLPFLAPTFCEGLVLL